MYSATLYDRQHLRQYTARVFLQQSAMVIHIDTEGSRETLEWIEANIDSVQAHNDGQVIVQSGLRFLEVKDPYFFTDLQRHFPRKKFGKTTLFDRLGVAGLIVAMLLLILPLMAAYFWLVPWIAEQAAQKVSVAVERQIGEPIFQSLTASYQLDSAATTRVQAFYDSLHFGGPYPMKITVVREPVVNAFAVPGGNIVVFDAILSIMETPDELAALLAHEASHVLLRHSTRSIFRSMAANAVLATLLGDFGTITTLIATQGDKLSGLSYSRSLEQEADNQGLQLLEKSNLPLTGMPALFRHMQASTEAGAPTTEVPNFLSTHPALENRIRATEEKIKGKPTGRMHHSLEMLWQEIKAR
jgi:predicted Zn-dependent protease